MDWSRGEDSQRAMSGMQKTITHEVGVWDLAVRMPASNCPWVTLMGALHFRGALNGDLTLAIETPEERMQTR